MTPIEKTYKSQRKRGKMRLHLRRPRLFLRHPIYKRRRSRLFLRHLTYKTHSVKKGRISIIPMYQYSMGIALSGSPGNSIWKPNSGLVGTTILRHNQESTIYEITASQLHLTSLNHDLNHLIHTSPRTRSFKILAICSANSIHMGLRMQHSMIQTSR